MNWYSKYSDIWHTASLGQIFICFADLITKPRTSWSQHLKIFTKKKKQQAL